MAFLNVRCVVGRTDGFVSFFGCLSLLFLSGRFVAEWKEESAKTRLLFPNVKAAA